MIDYASLDHNLRTVALVGEWLQYWAMMESELNRCMGRALALDGLQTYIVAKNVQFTAKTHILKTALAGSRKVGAADRERYTKLIDAIATETPVRNMLAHDMFLPSEKTDGVEFLVVKAKGQLKFPEEDWPIQTFQDWFARMTLWRQELVKLRQIIDRPATLAEALLAYQKPTGILSGLTGIAGASPPIPELLDSNSPEATPETEPQSPSEQPPVEPEGDK